VTKETKEEIFHHSEVGLQFGNTKYKF